MVSYSHTVAVSGVSNHEDQYQNAKSKEGNLDAAGEYECTEEDNQEAGEKDQWGILTERVEDFDDGIHL